MELGSCPSPKAALGHVKELRFGIAGTTVSALATEGARTHPPVGGEAVSRPRACMWAVDL